MGKALLVLKKMPKDCTDCPCYGSFYCYCNVAEQGVLKAVTRETKPDWCPLIPMSERKEALRCGGSFNVFDYERKGRQEGWNDCIDAICVAAGEKKTKE